MGRGLFDVLFPAHRMPRFDPERAFDLMERHAVANAFFPPTALRVLRTVDNPKARWELERRNRGAYEYPREVEFVPELPMTDSGKVRRNAPRERETRKD